MLQFPDNFLSSVSPFTKSRKSRYELNKTFYVESEDCEFKVFFVAEIESDTCHVSDREITNTDILDMSFTRMEFPFPTWPIGFKPENEAAKALYDKYFNILHSMVEEHLHENRYDVVAGFD